MYICCMTTFKNFEMQMHNLVLFIIMNKMLFMHQYIDILSQLNI